MSFRQKLIRHVTYPLNLWRNGDAAQLAYLREFELSQFLPEEQIRAVQFDRLRALLDHAYRTCPFYKDRFRTAGLTPGDIHSLEDLSALPVLTKQDIQDFRDQMVAEGWPEADLIANKTGGSTGTPLSFFLNNDRRRARAAATVRHNRWAGWDVGDRAVYLWGAPRDQGVGGWRSRTRRALLDPHLFLDATHLSESKLAQCDDILRNYRPRILLAYAKSAVLLARYLKNTGRRPHHPHAIVTSAEVLEPEERGLIEEVFGSRVFNRYGCREVSVIASECEEHRGLHTMAEGLYLEIVRGERPVPAGEPGSILVTDLFNYAMPLIRYQIGDMAAWEEGRCPCGRGLPRLGSISGRVTDFLVGSDGRLVAGASLTIFIVAERPSLGQVQIRQNEAGKVLYRIKPGRGFRGAEDLDYLAQISQRYLGEGTSVTWEIVDELSSEPSGKFIFSRSTVTPEFLRLAPPPGTPESRGYN
jgi:phenylacetate-CoA ligase